MKKLLLTFLITLLSLTSRVVCSSDVDLKSYFVDNLKTYYVENMVTISYDLSNSVLEKVTLLNTIKDENNFVYNSEVYQEILTFMSVNNILNTEEIAEVKAMVADVKRTADAIKVEEKRIAKEKRKAEEEIAKAKKKAEEKIAKEAGFNSYAEMQVEEKRKAEEEKRVAKEKRKAEEEKRVAKEKRKLQEGQEIEPKRINQIIQEWKLRAETNPGFRDLKPGALYKVFSEHCKGNKCYGLQNIKFSAESYREFSSSIGRSKEGVSLIRNLILDMGPIVASDGSFTSFLNDLSGESNIYMKMKQNLDAKYALDYEYSERDRQLFNEQEKDDLLGVYSNGQVAIRINRKERENSYPKDLWLYIEYRDVKSGKQFLEKNRPVIATLNDF